MNQPPDNPTDPVAIRAQIDGTRQRMDETIDALGKRFTGRHLADEALHFFRIQNENGNMNKITHKITTSADAAFHSVVATVKANPLPVVLIGTGIAWYLYNQSQRSAADDSQEPEGFGNYYGESIHQDASNLGIDPNDSTGMAAGLKEKAGTKLHELGERAHEMGERARRGAAELGDKSRELYRAGRQRVASTIERHPLESGLVCLALGLLGGLALPTSARVRRTLAPGVRQLRQRAGELADRGRVVIDRAAQAAKTEAEAQGFTSASPQLPAGM